MWSRVKTANEIVSSWKSRRGPGGMCRPGSAPFQRLDRTTMTTTMMTMTARWWCNDPLYGGSNSSRDFSLCLAGLPIACVNRVNGEVNDEEEVLINDSDNGRGMRASHSRGFVLQSAERAAADSIQPAKVHSLSISRLTLRSRLIDNEQSHVFPNYRINWRLAA